MRQIPPNALQRPYSSVERTHYSREEFAYAVGLSLGTVKEMIRDGRLRVVRVGRRILIPVAEVSRIGDAA